MTMETGNRLNHSKSRFVSSVKRAVAFAALGFQVLVSPMIVTSGVLTTSTAVAAPKKDKGNLNQKLRAAAGGKNDKKAVKTVKTLLAKGADVNAKGAYGVTALRLAASEGHTEIVKLLLEKGANVEAKDDFGMTALTTAVFFGHTEIVKLFLAKGADVNAKGEHDMTALIEATLIGHTVIAKLLLAKGADVNAKDDAGHTALDFARGNPEIVDLLRKHGAKE